MGTGLNGDGSKTLHDNDLFWRPWFAWRPVRVTHDQYGYYHPDYGYKDEPHKMHYGPWVCGRWIERALGIDRQWWYRDPLSGQSSYHYPVSVGTVRPILTNFDLS